MAKSGPPSKDQSERGLARFLPRQTITLSDSHGIHSISLSPRQRLGAIIGLVSLAIWGVIATITLAINSLAEDHMRQRSAALTLAYESRLSELALERDLLSDQLSNLTTNILAAQNQMLNFQQDILLIDAERGELDTRYSVLQSHLSAAIHARDTAATESRRRAVELAAVQTLMVERLGGQEDVIVTIEAMTGALADAVQARDTTQANMDLLTEEMATIDLQRELTAQRQERMFAQLEDAIEMSLVPMARMFDAAGMDIDSLLANVRRNYAGTGGISPELADFSDPVDQRLNDLLISLDQVAMLNIAAARIPLAMPIRTAFRFSSGFGPRGGRLHKGVDFAGAAGSPIYATADGVVSFSGRQNGFGNLVIVDHGGGFKTYYAHMNQRRVVEGARVARGDRLGDMGNTGRSTGVHLHYEIHKDGVAINPMTYIKAGRNVY